jgi:nicotinamide phosphoribosyltransferase
MRNTSLILRTDSYKLGHWPVYPDKTQHVYSYLESRGGLFAETVMFGLRYYLREYLSRPITLTDIDRAEAFCKAHFGTSELFNRKGWMHVLNHHNGLLPLRIKAAPEGTVITTRNVLMTIENTDPECWWATNHAETLLLKAWYPITVATLSREIKKLILRYLEETGDPSGLPFKLHDFGYRGVSSEESAAIGGAAHLVNFIGTDTILALEFLDEYYGEAMAGFSIPATEHSVMCARGEEGEVYQMERFLDTYGKGPYPAIACVSDTYNLWRACSDYWGGELRSKVEALTDKVLVVRPDSGDPTTVVIQTLETLERAFGSVTNDKGYKVLNHVRVIQGDGVNMTAIESILKAMQARRFSADNIAFGMGGALLQQCNRDTQKFAIKASSYVIDGRRKDYLKSPITDSGKRSKAGRLKLVRDENGVYNTIPSSEPGADVLRVVYENGRVIEYDDESFTDIRARADVPRTQTEFVDLLA